VMRRLLVVARLMMLAGLTMVFGSVFIVLCCLFVMLMNLGLCHSVLPDISCVQVRLTAPEIQLTRQIVYELIAHPERFRLQGMMFPRGCDRPSWHDKAPDRLP
jgi:hypothetical protein